MLRIALQDDAGDPAGEADHDRLAEELGTHVALGCADRAPHADLLDALEDRREHDVHDPNAADDERDRRDGAEHDVEDRLRPLLLLEQQLGHGDLEVGDVVVPALQHASNHIGHSGDAGGLVYLDDHLVELIVISFFGASIIGLGGVVVGVGRPRGGFHFCLCDFTTISVTEQHRGERNVDVHVRVSNAQALGRLR